MSKRTIQDIINMKGKEKISALTAYDHPTATILDRVGIDIILVGDSAAMVVAGHKTTIPITVDEMLYHTRMVSKAVKRSLVIADMPFLSFQLSTEEAVRNASRFIKEGGANGVKLEGGKVILDTVRHLVEIGIPVMGHIGLLPQAVNLLGYRVQGRDEETRKRLIEDAHLLQEAGCFAIVLEKIPESLGREITETLAIPTIGIGAGRFCDGQILVLHDIIGLYPEFQPRFVKRYAEVGKIIEDACRRYIEDVKTGKFPEVHHTFS
ncbi:3-methyl-2-oxobutanoate hydroxymethyltransferase [candidate division WOR-3 bacterium]|uniref:3-methyl-2-oxobutanoate hydroxymethyltransferase n=1 Tax=candidate division WOR-3 bacterium TaxID=2052148 RepID=A0A660SJ26_UNCW3|nr:MAG: 3-methyl-2-oxobutanoate hydroxymethyltransferase [candidate division WOR-3 bacterium]